MFNFRRLSPDDFPLMLEWLSKKHIKKWWDDGDDTLEKVSQHYGAADGTRRFILSDDDKPIGYFQYYFAVGNTIGIDQFIGDENYAGRGVGTETIKMFIKLIMRKHKILRIILDPSPENTRAIRCYEKVGFKHYETVKAEDETLAYMMQFKAGE